MANSFDKELLKLEAILDGSKIYKGEIAESPPPNLPLQRGGKIEEILAARKAKDPVFPEDGSIPMKAWYYSSAGKDMYTINKPGLHKALKMEGVNLREFDFDYRYFQDVALFTANGTLLLQADVPGDKDLLNGLTMGVVNSEDGFERITKITPAQALTAGIPYRKMKWTFIEGGGLITGRFSDGQTYAILHYDTVDRAQRFYKYKRGADIDENKAKALIASDLGIDARNIFPVYISGHLDLIMQALPGGVILLSDPSKTIETINELLSSRITLKERERLEDMRKLYTQGFARWKGNKPLLPSHTRHAKALDNIEADLQGRFKIIRVAGVFNEVKNFYQSELKHAGDNINFFNGFVGRNQSGQTFVITNHATGIPSLEKYWKSVLKTRGVSPDHVYFPGYYGSGAGLDCLGAPSGK
ncbi:hypothetical protein ACFL6Y_05345 [Elusimicrobiota bacterium]